jgi:hypothetical protein
MRSPARMMVVMMQMDLRPRSLIGFFSLSLWNRQEGV